MSEREEFTADSASFDDADCPIALESPYRMDMPNTPIQLYVGQLEVRVGDMLITGEGVIQKDWLPRSRVTFTISESEHSPFALLGKLGDAELSVPNLGSKVKVLITQVGSGGIHGVIHDRFRIGHLEKMRRINFHLTNLEPCFGKPVRDSSGMASWQGRLEWTTSEWRVRIDPLQGSHELIKQVKAMGGFGITYLGEIGRIDSKPFTSEEVDDVLQVIRHTLSFASGMWVAPVLINGYADDGSIVYRDWSNAIIAQWNSVQTWFSDILGNNLENIFRGFSLCWTDPIWRDALGRSIWWYVASHENSGGIDGSIILIQVALELLAWVVYVERGKIISEKGFETLSAPDKLRLLLKWMHVSSNIPPELTNLSAFAIKKKCPIGPWVFTEIRNSRVHPKKRTLAEKQGRTLFEARQLGMWYLELSVLFACEYEGKYSNRLTAKATWEVEQVPWADSKDS